jgi:hypothetical protein
LPGEFSLDLDSVSNGSEITFTAVNGANTVIDSATIDFNGSTWTVKDTFSIPSSGDVTGPKQKVPEPSLSLLLGLGLGAVVLMLGWKKE